jgi:pilus assembly protein CpaD
MYCHDLAIAGRRAAKFGVRSLLIASFALALGGCNTTARDTTGSIPDDYRERHPIRIKEGQNTLTLLVGSSRGELSPLQRVEVLAFAQNLEARSDRRYHLTRRSAAATNAPHWTR